VKVNKKVYNFLFDSSQHWRYRIAYGGRGGSKTFDFSQCLLIMAMQRKIRILCCREIQNTIKDSVHRILSDHIEREGLKMFHVEQECIWGDNGSEFIFKGLKHNYTSIKSLEGIDYCWVEEAENISRESLDVLIPTIRKPGSELWFTFNPRKTTNEIYQRFVLNQGERAIVLKINYYDNPFLPEVLRFEADQCKRKSEKDYRHIWLGEPLQLSENSPFRDIKFKREYTARESVAFLDVAYVGGPKNCFTALSIAGEHFDALQVVGFCYPKAWHHCVDEIVFAVKKYGIKHLQIDTTAIGNLPVELLQASLPGVSVTGSVASANKHGMILSCAVFAEKIFLTDECDPEYKRQVMEYDAAKECKEIDAPDSLARLLVFMGLLNRTT
jgi:hypothetical protein